MIPIELIVIYVIGFGYLLIRVQLVFLMFKRILGDVKYKVAMTNSKKDILLVNKFLGKLGKKFIRRHYRKSVFTFKSIKVCEYNIRKEIGML